MPRVAHKHKRQASSAHPGKPRTALGRKVLAAREEYQVAGGRPVSLDEVRLEVARRRGERGSLDRGGRDPCRSREGAQV